MQRLRDNASADVECRPKLRFGLREHCGCVLAILVGRYWFGAAVYKGWSNGLTWVETEPEQLSLHSVPVPNPPWQSGPSSTSADQAGVR